MTNPARRLDRYGLIGHPVAHSYSPRIHRHFAEQTGQRLTYELIDAPAQDFRHVVERFFAAGGGGLNVTVPHKARAFALADRNSERARMAGAVNTLSREADGSLSGDNTDGAGLVRDLLVNRGVALCGERILLLGAGGAARGVIAPLLGEHPDSLLVANRTAERAESIARHFAVLGPVSGCGFDALAGQCYSLVINATSAGLAGARPDVPASIFRGAVFYDMGYAAGGTALMRWAEVQGATRSIGGFGMLVEQAAESFLVWRGVRPETGAILAALEAGTHAGSRTLP